jgi:hypothetical protein
MDKDELLILFEKLTEIGNLMAYPKDDQENLFDACVKLGFLIGWIDTKLNGYDPEIDEKANEMD